VRFGSFLMPSHPPERVLLDAIEWDLQCIRWADELGFDEVWIGEHQTLQWEPVTAPDLVLAQAIKQTQRIRLGAAGHLLPFIHPVALANRVAQLDHMAQGRLNFAGIVASAPSDHKLLCLEGGMDTSRRMTAEALDIIVKVWTADGPFTYAGDFWSVDYEPGGEFGEPWLRPFQSPHPPIAIPGIGPASQSHIRAGALGYNPISFNVAEHIVAEHWTAYEQGAASAGRVGDRRNWRILKDVFVADTDEEARRWSVDSYLARFYHEYHLPLLKSIDLLEYLKHDESVPDCEVDVNYLADTIFLIGSPDTVVEKITELYERLGGFGMLLVLGSDYVEAPERWHRSMELLATEVAPRIAHLDGTVAAGQPAL
jgi:alkanesulfonate monooxygenase SsuD/methylene tetrahydromethanopterin reductase-like flavin-dependent oxidoreductase (luciferase family)